MGVPEIVDVSAYSEGGYAKSDNNTAYGEEKKMTDDAFEAVQYRLSTDRKSQVGQHIRISYNETMKP